MAELEALLSEVLFGRGPMLSVRIIGVRGCWLGYRHWKHADEDFIFAAANGKG